MSSAPWLEIIASSIWACAGIILALVSLNFSYRQNRGWKPILLLQSYGDGSSDDRKYYVVDINFEFWNRRKHPVAVANVEILFSRIQLDQTVQGFDYGGWQPSSASKLWHHRRFVVSPNEHHIFNARMPVPNDFIVSDDLDEDMSDAVRIEISYFDPVEDRYIEEKLNFRFNIDEDDPKVESGLTASLMRLVSLRKRDAWGRK